MANLFILFKEPTASTRNLPPDNPTEPMSINNTSEVTGEEIKNHSSIASNGMTKLTKITVSTEGIWYTTNTSSGLNNQNWTTPAEMQ